MKGKTGLRKHVSSIQVSVIFAAICFSIIAAAFAWGGIRMDLSGNSIVQDVVAPAGGGVTTDTGGVIVTGTLGQCCAGLSDSPGGTKLFHGVHAPIQAGTAVRNWADY